MDFEFILIFVGFIISPCNGCGSTPENKDKNYILFDRVPKYQRNLSSKDIFNLHHAFTFDDKTWTDNTVIYEIAEGFDRFERKSMFAAMADIQNSSCIRFAPFNESQHTDYVTIRKDYVRRDAAQSDVGCRHNGGQNIWFGIDMRYSYSYRYTILHEFLHTLGFHHHHERSDRDIYIKFNTENMNLNLANIAANYLRRVEPDPQVKFLTPFDFDSVLLYDAYKDTKNGAVTIVSKIDGKEVPKYHANHGLSMYDKILLNKFYNCTEK